MPVIAYRLQPWAFVDRLVFDLCPDAFQLVPMAPTPQPKSARAFSPTRSS